MFFYSKDMEKKQESPSAGYYSFTLYKSSGKQVLRSNNERAFVLSQFQDLLGRRSLLEEPDARHRLASHIDLLAFSILDQDIKCILFAISKNAVRTFAELLSNRLIDFQSEWRISAAFHSVSSDHAYSMKVLSGPYDALNKSVELHLRHSDWEYDRYSSIGFYLHDRRGDWMHLWRICQLYENNNKLYRQLVEEQTLHMNHNSLLATVQPFVPLSHA